MAIAGNGVTTGRYANCSDDNSNAEGAVGYDPQPSTSKEQTYENVYETISNDPAASNSNQVDENIYESIDEIRRRTNEIQPSSSSIPPPPAPPPNLNDIPSCSSTYGRIGNAYGRIDIIGHGIGRIERHLSSSCGSGIDNGSHYSNLEALYGGCDPTGRISKVSVQWLLVNKWLPLWIANTDNGKDYRIIDFLLGHRGDYEGVPPQGGASRDPPTQEEEAPQQLQQPEPDDSQEQPPSPPQN